MRKTLSATASTNISPSFDLLLLPRPLTGCGEKLNLLDVYTKSNHQCLTKICCSEMNKWREGTGATEQADNYKHNHAQRLINNRFWHCSFFINQIGGRNSDLPLCQFVTAWLCACFIFLFFLKWRQSVKHRWTGSDGCINMHLWFECVLWICMRQDGVEFVYYDVCAVSVCLMSTCWG